MTAGRLNKCSPDPTLYLRPKSIEAALSQANSRLFHMRCSVRMGRFARAGTVAAHILRAWRSDNHPTGFPQCPSAMDSRSQLGDSG